MVAPLQIRGIVVEPAQILQMVIVHQLFDETPPAVKL